MATETSTETVTPASSEEPSGNAGTAAPEGTTPETGGNGTPEAAKPEEQVLPDTHPLVKAFETQKTELKALKAAGQQSKDKTATDLTEATTKLQSTTDELTALQTQYSRLESFLSAVGGPLSKALDSKSFTTKLFESDTEIDTLVKEWYAANPSATSTALGSSAAAPAQKGPSINELLRAAAK